MKKESRLKGSGYDRLTRESLRREWGILKFAWQMAKHYHLLLLVVMVLEVVIGVLPTAAVYFFQDAVSSAGQDILSLVTRENFILVILLLTIYLLLQKGVSVITTFAIIDVEYNIRMRYLSKLLSFSVEAITRKLDNRSAFSMTRETSMTSGLIPMIYRSFVQAPIAIVSAVVLLLVISPRMLAVVTVMITVIIAISLLMRRRLKEFHREQYDAMSSLLQYFNEWLSGHRILRVYGAEGFYGKKMISTFNTISDVSRRHKLYGTAQSIMVEILTYVAIILFVVFLSDSDGRVDVGIVLSFPALILIVRGEILKLVGGYQQLANTESSVARLQEVLQMEVPSKKGDRWEGQIERIEFRDVSYRYDSLEEGEETPASTYILNHAEMALVKGRLNVITGPNGTGKSTTLNLILGLYEPQEGVVSYNGRDISGYAPASLLSQFAIVEQEPFVFQGSLYDNIAMGRNIGEEEIKGYLREYGLDYLIGKDGCLLLPIGAKGRTLSSGEKQRLALIRALVGKPSVVILDEPTSNIDHETTILIKDVMNKIAKSQLVICVSHDAEVTSNNKHNIYRIENGNYSKRWSE